MTSKHDKTIIRYSRRRCCTFAMLSCFGAAVLADEPANRLAIEEVVVTAQKREQSLTDVPGSVAAITSETLELSSTTEFADIGKLTSGINIDAPSSGLGAQIRIRGVGTNPFTVAIRPSVGIFLDDVPQSRVETAFTHLNDVERVEILKGPQATLYGKEVSSGVISIVSAKPSTEQFTFNIDGKYSAGYRASRELRSVVNLPISDSLALRVSGYGTQSEDSIENIETGDSEEADNQGAKARLLWLFNDALSAILTLEHHDFDIRHSAFERVAYGSFTQMQSELLDTDLLISDGFDEKIQTNAAGGLDQRIDNTYLHVNWMFSESWDMQSISSYQRFEREQTKGEGAGGFSDGASGLFSLFLVNGGVNDRSYTQEFRLNYQGEQLNAMLGLFYAESRIVDDYNILLNAGIPNDATPFALSAVPLLAFSRRESKDLGLYSHNTYSLSDDVELTFGLRYSDVEKDEEILGQAFGGSLGTLPKPDYIEPQADTWRAWSGTLKASWHLDDDRTFYLGLDRGFKAGGFNSGVTVGVEPPASVPEHFEEETANSLEMGVKGFFFDRRARLSSAVFVQQYDDYQVDAQDPNSVQRIVSNAAKVVIQGWETEVYWIAQEFLIIDASLAYIDARFDKYLAGQCTDAQLEAFVLSASTGACEQDLSDETLNGHSPLSANFNTQWLGQWSTMNLNWYLRLEAAYRDKRKDFPSLDRRTAQGGYSLFNMRLAFLTEDLRWQLALWGKNLSDKEYVAFFDQGRDGLYGIQARIGEGRSFGMEVKYQYE